MKRFARRILSLEELGVYEKRFLGGNIRGGEGLWEKEVARWLGVRWERRRCCIRVIHIRIGGCGRGREREGEGDQEGG